MEENLNRVEEWDGAPVGYRMDRKRVVIEIDDTYSRRRYIFRGVFAYDKNNSDPRTVRYHDKISDEF